MLKNVTEHMHLSQLMSKDSLIAGLYLME